jgi:hypothetical protein
VYPITEKERRKLNIFYRLKKYIMPPNYQSIPSNTDRWGPLKASACRGLHAVIVVKMGWQCGGPSVSAPLLFYYVQHHRSNLHEHISHALFEDFLEEHVKCF